MKAVTAFIARTATLETPEVRVETENELPAGRFQFKINDVWTPLLTCLRPDEMVIYGAPWELTGAGIAIHSIADAVSGFAFIASSNDDATKAKCDGKWPYFDEVSFIKTSLNYALRAHAGDFLATPAVGVLLTTKLKAKRADSADLLQRAFGGLKEFPLAMTAVLRRLLDEQVPICDLPGIVNQLAAMGKVDDETKLDLDKMVEAARLGVRALALQYATDDTRTLTLRTDHLAGILTKDQLNDAADVAAMRKYVWNLVKDRFEDCVFVVTPELRAYVRELLRLEFPNVAVLREEEIAREIQLVAWPLPIPAG
jgi:flagellar biosynthesis component FlhA